MITVSAIALPRLAAIWMNRQDEQGRPLEPFAAAGWEPLRCCLTMPAPGESIALISYTPLTVHSAWAETGPVYLHPDPCPGYATPAELPPAMRTGPKILRSYRADDTLNYDQLVQVPDGVDIAEELERLLDQAEVATVHVRAVLSQCFGYSVSR